MKKLKKVIIDAPIVPIAYIGVGLLATISAIVFKNDYKNYGWMVTYGILMIVGGIIFLHTSIRGKVIIWNNIMAQLKIPKNSQILDLGTGHGLVLLKFATRLAKDGHATGIDLWHKQDQSNNTLEYTQMIVQEKGLADIVTLQTADMLDLPFRSHSFDFVTASMALHNIRTKKKRGTALSEAIRVLKDSGTLIIVDTGNHKKEYITYLRSKNYQIEQAKTYGIVGWWTGPWMTSYLIIAKKQLNSQVLQNS
ncbi:class I SAM-dependent methyltransferase [Periweissella beninensis]|uniref:Class I SAM-dependent methyltransferase n=1 Tax=Periweissella beninensis TaxID=504936 RepID=A0ABT0VIW3_9LACO|nr:class I SAM-dependent methyltransferase [Periweissella beninensis]MBM7544461.1 ubiquinone/menaquinone biosynthesis C-methylase UbiE [Periweissella beninensis]MCM2437063.1 class I SAM-dependent methyltransferase [Periweissella beninensis]MCT4395764.1 class I SAM-dependent methyltransferase [Periweissella beninensis]